MINAEVDRPLPCPFCGTKALIMKHKSPVGISHSVYCPNEDCYVKPESCQVFGSPEKVIKLWNRRR